MKNKRNASVRRFYSGKQKFSKSSTDGVCPELTKLFLWNRHRKPEKSAFFRSNSLLRHRSLLLSFILLFSFCFSACSSKGEMGSAASDNGSKIKVALLVTGTFGDKSFNDSAQRGMDRIKRELGDRCEVTMTEMGGDKTKFEPSLIDASESDADIIITGTWDMKEVLERTASLYPDKKYIIFDTDVEFLSYNLDNVYSMDYKQNEAGFLSGVLAALVTSSEMEFANSEKKIGFVGARDTSPVINDSLVGYIEGAQFADADVKVEVSYIGSFVDSAKAKEIALSQYNNGVDIIFVAAGPASVGAIEAAQASGNYIIGVDSDQAAAYGDTDTASYILSSAVKGIDATLFSAVEHALKDQLPFGTHEKLGLAEGAVGLAENNIYTERVPQEIRDEVDAAKQSLLDGRVMVDSAFGMDADRLQEIRNSAK